MYTTITFDSIDIILSECAISLGLILDTNRYQALVHPYIIAPCRYTRFNVLIIVFHYIK